jgi:hypothetical protein
MNVNILLSIIVPVYNAEHTLKRCLDSIVNQPIKNFEIIVVDDGSRDDSQNIIHEYVQKYPGLIKSFTKVNKGPGDTRNFGINHSSGRYVTFVDSDDYIAPDYNVVVNGMIDQHHPDMLIISYNRIYDKKQSIFEKLYKFNSWSTFNVPVDTATTPELICKMEVACWLRIVKKEIFTKDDRLFFSNGRIAEDLEASLKWYLNVDKIVVTHEKIYNYLIKSNTLNFAATHIEQFVEVIDSACAYYKGKERFQEFYAELEYLFAKHLLISNMLRLRASKQENKYGLFLSLRAALLEHFPQFSKNKYLKDEPLYVRVAIYLSYYFPRVFSFIL